MVSLHARSTARLMTALAAAEVHVVLGWDPVPADGIEVLDVETCPPVVPARRAPPARREPSPSRTRPGTADRVAPRPNPVAYDRFAAAMDATGSPWTLVGTALGADDLLARVLSGFGIGLAYGSARGRPAFPVPCAAPDEPGLRFTRTLAWRRRGDPPRAGALPGPLGRHHGVPLSDGRARRPAYPTGRRDSAAPQPWVAPSCQPSRRLTVVSSTVSSSWFRVRRTTAPATIPSSAEQRVTGPDLGPEA